MKILKKSTMPQGSSKIGNSKNNLKNSDARMPTQLSGEIENKTSDSDSSIKVIS